MVMGQATDISGFCYYRCYIAFGASGTWEGQFAAALCFIGRFTLYSVADETLLWPGADEKTGCI